MPVKTTSSVNIVMARANALCSDHLSAYSVTWHESRLTFVHFEHFQNLLRNLDCSGEVCNQYSECLSLNAQSTHAESQHTQLVSNITAKSKR